MKIEMLSEKLKQNEAALIISPVNRTFFTGFTSSSGYLMITKNKSIFITDSRYIESAKKEIKSVDEVTTQQNVKSQLANFAKANGIEKILFESKRTTISEFNIYKEKLSDFEVCGSERLCQYIEEIRLIKSEDEKQKIIKAQRIAESALDYILKFIEIGKTEKEIALELDYFMLKNGADGLSFETIAVSGKNSSLPHGVPSDKKIEHGDFITMDFGAVVDSYHSDMTRTVAVGEVGTRQSQVYETVLKAQNKAISVVKAGIKAREVDFAARNIIDKAGFDDCFGHGTGHGVGIEIHEKPSISPASHEFLSAGNVITVEPGIYIEGSMGVRIEDMLFVTEEGYENLTKAKKSLIVL